MMLSRRGILQGLLGAPLVVAAAHIMPIRAPKLILAPPLDLTEELMGAPISGNTCLTIQMITREAVRQWKNSNAFIASLDDPYILLQ